MERRAGLGRIQVAVAALICTITLLSPYAEASKGWRLPLLSKIVAFQGAPERPAAVNSGRPSAPAPATSTAAKSQQLRCNPAAYKPAEGKPLLYLYVWAGAGHPANASVAPAQDFVATVDVTTGSPCFGQVISEADVPTAGNEPHHVGLDINSTVLGVGGFNSWLRQQPSMYFFDVATEPAQPRYIKAITPTLGAITDDFFRLPSGGFLVSLMGNTTGGSPGRVAEIDANLNLVAEHPRSNRSIHNFNPHGLALTPPGINRMVTLDYVEYRTTFKPYTKALYRTTARIWDQKNREIIKVLDLGPQAQGLMTARYIPNGKAQFLITAGHGVLYVLDAELGTAKQVYNFQVGVGHCVLSALFRNATRVFVSLYTTDQVKLLDIADLNKIKVLQTINLPRKAGPHATVLAPGDKLLAVSTYYVQHDPSLGYTAPFTDESEKGIRLYGVADDGNSFVPHPEVPYIDFKNLFPHKGLARPHGMAFKAVAASK